MAAKWLAEQVAASDRKAKNQNVHHLLALCTRDINIYIYEVGRLDYSFFSGDKSESVSLTFHSAV